MTDYHVHPDFSLDAHGGMQDYCRAAMQRGVAEVCFTTHYEPDPARTDIEWVRVQGQLVSPHSDWPESYFEELARCRSDFPDLAVLAGVEVGYEMGLDGRIADFLQRWPFDFVLGAIHLLDHVAITSGTELPETRRQLLPLGPEAVLDRYFRYLKSAAGSGLFDCIAHIDIWRKYLADMFGTDLDALARPHIEPALKVLAASGTGIEVNTSAMRRGQAEPYPRWQIIKQAHKAGITVFTVGSDAHRPEALGSDISSAVASLAALGIAPVRFRKRQVQSGRAC